MNTVMTSIQYANPDFHNSSVGKNWRQGFLPTSQPALSQPGNRRAVRASVFIRAGNEPGKEAQARRKIISTFFRAWLTTVPDDRNQLRLRFYKALKTILDEENKYKNDKYSISLEPRAALQLI